VPPTRTTLSAAAFSLKKLSQAKPDRQPKKDLCVSTVGASDAAREAMFHRIRQDLGGVWLGLHGMTYDVMLEGTTWQSTTWPCVRRSTSGEAMTYTLRWNGENCVTWGTHYSLSITDLQKCLGKLVWHSTKRKRSFVWSRTLGGQGPDFQAASDRIEKRGPRCWCRQPEGLFLPRPSASRG